MIYNVDRSDPAIELIGVRKSFGPLEVLLGVDLAVPAGQVLGLLGANGAGKSTLIGIATGLVRADAGEVRVAGVELGRGRAKPGARIGLAPQALGLYPQLSAQENLRCFAELAGIGRREAKARSAEVLELLDLARQARQLAGRLSGGQQRRLHTAIALVHRPAVLFLDEPTVGADVPSRAGILEVVKRIAADGATVVYTTHYLPELEQLDPRIAVLRDGRIVADGPLRQIVDRFARPSVRLRFRGAAPDVTGWRADGGVLEAIDEVTNPGAALACVLQTPGVRSEELLDVEVVRADLETAYLAITGEHSESKKEGSDVNVPDVTAA